jgi:CheY-like chemotaxis protein
VAALGVGPSHNRSLALLSGPPGTAGDWLMSDWTSNPRTAAPLEGASLLLVDDHPGARRAVARVLKLEGALLVEAGDGQEAIDILERDESELLDVVLTDLEMPVVSGHELIAGLRECRPDLPVVAMTGYTRPAGFDATVLLFYKPVESDELVRTLVPLVRRSQKMRRVARQMRADAAESPVAGEASARDRRAAACQGRRSQGDLQDIAKDSARAVLAGNTRIG